MSTPNYRSENHEATYEYLANQEMHTVMPWIARKLITSQFHPEISASEKTHFLIDEIVEEKQPLIIVANHVQKCDHHVMSAVVRDIPKLDELVWGRTIALAKSTYFFKFPSRFIYKNLDSWPVYRGQDIDIEKENFGTWLRMFISTMKDAEPIIDNPKVKKTSVGRAFNSMERAAVHKIDQGYNIAGFPEGTRNNGNWRELQPLFDGISHIGSTASLKHSEAKKRLEQKILDGEAVSLEDTLMAKRIGFLIMSIAYKDKTRSSRHNPVVRLNVLPARSDPAKLLTAQIEHKLEQGLEVAYSIMDSRNIRTV